MTELKTYRQVIQAFLDGKEVEYYDVRLKQWIEQESMVSLYIEDLDNPTVSDYRIAKELIKIGDVEFPKPVRDESDLEKWETYYSPSLVRERLYNVYSWDGDGLALRCLKHGLVHKTKEAAILHAKALIKISGGSYE